MASSCKGCKKKLGLTVLRYRFIAFSHSQLFILLTSLNADELIVHRASMADRKHTREILTVLFLCVLWYVVSSSNNVIGKMLLNEFPYPMTMTMVQLLSIAVYSGPFFNMWGVRKYVDISWKYYFKLIVPLAFGKFFASVFSHVSIWKVPVSYAHTVKATMPLFTVILARIIMGEKQTTKVYLSLVPIIAGVGIATITEISFDTIGLASALASTMGFSLQNIYSKKVLHDTGIHHLRLLHILGRLALFMFLPIWIFVDMFHLLDNPDVSSTNYRVMALLFVDGVLNWLQNIVAFSVLSLVTPLTYAVANASKRIFVIAISLFILGNPVTGLNICGMMLAILGVFYYNKTKYDSKQSQKKQTLLPFSQKNWHDRSNGYTLYPQKGNTVNNGIAENHNHLPSNGVSNGTIMNGSSNSFIYNSNSSSSNLLFI